MDQKISLKNPDKYFSTNMFVELNDQSCQDKEDEMFEPEILDNYAAQILDAKYEQVDTKKLPSTRNI